MSTIIKQDTNGVKPLLNKGELGYDDWSAGGDVGRVYVGTGSANIPLANKNEFNSHATNTSNPHGVTKAQIGLGNVDNTSDASKPISTAAQTALDTKAPISNPQFTNHISIGNTPISSWSSLKVMEAGGGVFFGSNNISALTGSNCYYDGQWRYKVDGPAGLQLVNQGSHLFRVAVSGLAGEVISWITVANIDATGMNAVGGSASVPGYGFTTDTDTGIYSAGANELGITTGGVSAGKFTSAGWVGNVTGNVVNKTSSVGAAQMPSGTTAERPTGVDGLIRYNSTTLGFEGYFNGQWQSVGGGQMLGNALVKAVSYNAQTISENITVPAGVNAYSVGNVTIAAGGSISIAAGSVYKIL